MSGGTKIFFGFLGGMVTGAAGLAYLNRKRLDFSYMKSITTDCIARGINLKDQMVCKVMALKEDFEDMAAEARDTVDRENMADMQQKAEQK